MNIVNLTPHTLNIHNEDGNLVVAVEPSGSVARIAMERRKVSEYSFHGDLIPVFNTFPGELTGLPESATQTIYVVSGFVRAAVPERGDVFQPGELLRNKQGQVIGCIGLSR